MGRRRLLVGVLTVVFVMTAMPIVAVPVTGAAIVEDSVVGSGTMTVHQPPLPGAYPFSFDVHSGPSGENPTGTVTTAFYANAPVTCLHVRQVAFNPPFAEATINVQTASYGLVTLTVSEGSPEGLPDFITSKTFSSRAATDCSPLGFGDGNVQASVTTGDIVIVDAVVPPTTGGFHGTVRAGGIPAGGVVISVLDEWPSWVISASTLTAADGTWNVDGLAPGSYRVRFRDLAGTRPRQWWQGGATYASATPVALAAGEDIPLDADLGETPAVGIAGTVRNHTGTPLPGVWVQVFTTTSYAAGAITDAGGLYRVDGLASGAYFVRFVDLTPGQSWSSWHPGVLLFQDATMVSVTAPGLPVDATLHPTT